MNFKEFYESKDVKNFKNLRFIRWGEINPVYQHGYRPDVDKDASFHEPPARKGFYAFPYPYIESFLLGTSEYNPQRHELIRREDGSLVGIEDPDVSEYKKQEMSNKIGVIKYPLKGLGKNRDKGVTSPFFDLNKKYKRGQISRDEYDKEFKKISAKRRDVDWVLIRHKPPKIFNHNGMIWHHLTPDSPTQYIKRKSSWYLSDIDSYKKLLGKQLHNMKQYHKREGIPVSKDHLEVFIERIK